MLEFDEYVKLSVCYYNMYISEYLNENRWKYCLLSILKYFISITKDILIKSIYVFNVTLIRKYTTMW